MIELEAHRKAVKVKVALLEKEEEKIGLEQKCCSKECPMMM
jgi:hypothetical protein